MKVLTNHLPREFHKLKDVVVEANLKELTTQYPALKADIQRSVETGMKRAGLRFSDIDFEDETSVIRMLVDKKELVACEIGHEDDDWQLQATQFWGKRDITGLLR